MAVAANLLSVSLLLPSSVQMQISLILLTAIAEANLRPLMMVCELVPCSTCSLTSFSTSPAKTTTDVVPSPTSASWDRAMSVSILAAGWTMSRSYFYQIRPRFHSCRVVSSTFMTVAPSFVMVCLPLASTSRRSPPYGPNVLRIVSCTLRQACIFDKICPFPCEASVPSFRTIIVGVCPPKDMFQCCGPRVEEFAKWRFGDQVKSRMAECKISLAKLQCFMA